MRKDEEDLVKQFPKAYAAAKQSALLKLHEDARWLGAPKLREKVVEHAALSVLVGSTRDIGKAAYEAMERDNVELCAHGLNVGIAAAYEAVMKLAEAERPPEKKSQAA
jgi:hypothetical protein